MKTYSVIFQATKDGPELVFVCGLDYSSAARVASNLIEEGFVYWAGTEED